MRVARRVLLPAILASIPAQIALILLFGNRSVTSLFDDPVVDWAGTAALLAALIGLGYLAIVLPIVRLLVKLQLGKPATLSLLLIAAAVGGAAVVASIVLPALFYGGDSIAALYLALLGSTVGVIATLVWLPFNMDMLDRC